MFNKTWVRLWLVGLFVFGFALGVVANDSEFIKFGYVAGLTGPAAYPCRLGSMGFTLAVEEINASGGLLGKPIKIYTQDTKGIPVGAVTAVTYLIEQGIGLLQGCHHSSSTLAVMPVVQDYEVLLVNAQSSNPAITERAGVGGNPWVFRVNPTDDHFAPVMSQVIVEQNGDKRIAFVSRNDDWGRAATESFAEWIEKRGGTVIAKYFYPMEGPWDHTSTLAKIKSLDPDGVFFIGVLDPAIPFIQQFYEQGLDATIYSRGMSLGEELFERVGSLVSGACVAEPYFVEIDTEANHEFLEKFRNRWGEDPVYQALTQYAACLMLAEAVRIAGTGDPAAVRDALEGVVLDSVTGRIEFDSHHQAYLNIYIGKAICDGDGCYVEVVAEGKATPPEGW